ncbi:hypothetical protein H7I76_37690, partial [Mycolicibacterium vaccae]|nr:hypothetical protein [Mycolicibacterium vaccae]
IVIAERTAACSRWALSRLTQELRRLQDEVAVLENRWLELSERLDDYG